jgi:hypothetical protein
MGRNLLFVIFLLISTAAFAQKAEELIPQLLDSAQTYQFSNYDKANQLAANAEKLIRQAGVSAYPAALIRSYRIRITSNRYFARPQLVKKYLDEAEASLKQFKRDLGQEYFSLRIEIKISRAGYLQETENYDGALALFLEILDEIKQLPSSSENCLKLYRTMQYIALIHRIKGEFESSINQYLASIPYFDCYEDSKYPPDYSLVFRNVGMVFLAKQDFKMPESIFFERAIPCRYFGTDPIINQLLLPRELYWQKRWLHFTENRNNTTVVCMCFAMLKNILNTVSHFRVAITSAWGKLMREPEIMP